MNNKILFQKVRNKFNYKINNLKAKFNKIISQFLITKQRFKNKYNKIYNFNKNNILIKIISQTLSKNNKIRYIMKFNK